MTPPQLMMTQFNDIWQYAEASMKDGTYPLAAMLIYQVPRDTHDGKSDATVAGLYWGCGTLLYNAFIAPHEHKETPEFGPSAVTKSGRSPHVHSIGVGTEPGDGLHDESFRQQPPHKPPRSNQRTKSKCLNSKTS